MDGETVRVSEIVKQSRHWTKHTFTEIHSYVSVKNIRTTVISLLNSGSLNCIALLHHNHKGSDDRVKSVQCY